MRTSEGEPYKSFLRSRTFRSLVIEDQTGEIRKQDYGDGFCGIRRLAGDGNNGKNGENDKEQGHQKTESRKQLHPERAAERRFFSRQHRDCKKREVGDRIKGEGPDEQKFERLLRTDTDEDRDAGHEGDATEEKDGVDRGAVAGMQTREPLRQEMVPSGAHGEASVSGKVEAEAGEIICEQKENRHRDDHFADASAAERYAKRLRDGADDVNVVGRNVRQDRARAENVEQCDQRGG